MSSNSRSAAKNKINNDPVDELKRRSRRRLVGSIALFLAAIIIVPALVETEPQQTPSDIELVVPARPNAQTTVAPVLTAPKLNRADSVADQPQNETDTSANTQALAQVVPPKEEGKAQDSKPEPQPEIKNEAKPTIESKTEVRAEPKVESKPESKAEPKPEAKPEAKPAPKSVDDPIAQFAKAEVFWVQVTALSDKARAEALRKELSDKGFPAKTESTTTANGVVYRVRVGPLAGQPAADESKANLAKAGYSGRVVK